MTPEQIKEISQYKNKLIDDFIGSDSESLRDSIHSMFHLLQVKISMMYAKDIAGQQSVLTWIPVTPETMPEKLTRVLIIVESKMYDGRIKKQVAIAEYVPYKTVPEEEYMADEYHGDGDYDEDKDEYFTKEGWYEHNLVEETHWKVTGNVTAWLPQPPVK